MDREDKKVLNVMLQILLAVAAFAAGPDQSGDGASQMPNCAVMSAYTLIRHSGISAKIEDVSRWFPLRSSRMTSVSELRHALQQFGIHTSAVRTNSVRLSTIQSPAILYFDAGRWPRTGAGGHFVTMIQQDATTVTLLDWNRIDPEIRLSREYIESRWSGVAVVLDRFTILPQRSHLIVVGVALLLVTIATYTRKWKERTAAVTLLMLLSFLSGCGVSSKPSPTISEPLLSCASPFIDLGIVDGGRPIEGTFKLVVNKWQRVRLKNITKSCACMTVGDDLVGRWLEPESSHLLKVSVRPDGDDGGEATVRTFSLLMEPDVTAPVSLAIQYRRRSRPRISVPELVVDTAQGQLVRAVITVTYRRSESDPAVPVIADKVVSTDFALVNLTSATELVERGPTPGAGKLAVDRTKLTLQAAEHHRYGTFRGTLRVGFGDGSEQVIPTRIIVLHPFRPVMPTVFLGRTVPGGRSVVKLGIQRTAVTPPTVSRIESTLASVNATMVSASEIEISAEAPTTPGRWQGKLTVYFDNASIACVSIPFSGIVVP